MKTLLAIINKPNDSKAFIKYSILLASSLNRDIFFLYIQHPDSYALGSPETVGAASLHIQETLKFRSEEAAKIIAKNIKEISQEIPVVISINFASEIGILTQKVNYLVDNNEMGMVILEGDKNQSFWAQGNTNMEIIQQANCPVWIIPHNMHFEPFKNVLFTTNYTEADVETLKRLVQLTVRFSPNITALHVSDNQNFNEKIKKAGFTEFVRKEIGYPNLNVNFMSNTNESSVGELINNYAVSVDTDLIAILKTDQGFFESIFKSSTTKQLINEAQLPVLVYHEK